VGAYTSRSGHSTCRDRQAGEWLRLPRGAGGPGAIPDGGVAIAGEHAENADLDGGHARNMACVLELYASGACKLHANLRASTLSRNTVLRSYPACGTFSQLALVTHGSVDRKQWSPEHGGPDLALPLIKLAVAGTLSKDPTAATAAAAAGVRPALAFAKFLFQCGPRQCWRGPRGGAPGV
jgi:hypothetical protein